MLKRIILLILCMTAILFAVTACTQYERDGCNPKPFNAPAGWELQPYSNYQLRN